MRTVYQVVASRAGAMRHGRNVYRLVAGRVCSEWMSRANAERNMVANTLRYGGEYKIVEVRHE